MIEAMASANRGRKNSPELREKKRQAAFRREAKKKAEGYSVSAETRAKIGAASRGRKHSAATKAKMSAARMGHKCTPETRERMSQAAKRRKGRTLSAETLQKTSASAKLRCARQRAEREALAEAS